MAIAEKVTQLDDLFLYEIMRNPVLFGEFINNFDKTNKEEQFEFSIYQKEWLLDFSNYVSICCSRAVGKCTTGDSKILNTLTGEYRTVEELYLSKKK